MFDETLVVQSAISAFNNAALVAPTFFWVGVLALPLMALAYFYGADFMRRIGWRRPDLMQNSCVLTVAITLIWLISFGGNYDVLRDGRSVLPFCIAGVVFVCCGLLGAASRTVPLPRWRGTTLRHRAVVVAATVALAFFVGLSGVHTWWGAALQIAAFGGGLALGRTMPRYARTAIICPVVILGVTTLILMQPEFFRFGQLGALGALHMLALLAVGGAIAAALAVRYVRPAGRIHHSAYVKLKWMLRFVSMLAIGRVLLPESVPVFLGAIGGLFAMFAMSVWHANAVPKNLDVHFWAIVLGAFGLITTLPVISALGVMLWADTDADSGKFADAKFLL